MGRNDLRASKLNDATLSSSRHARAASPGVATAAGGRRQQDAGEALMPFPQHRPPGVCQGKHLDLPAACKGSNKLPCGGSFAAPVPTRCGGSRSISLAGLASCRMILQVP